MATPDEHLSTLRKMLADYEYRANLTQPTSRPSKLFAQRADALAWILDLNSYGVDPSELVGAEP